MAEAKAFKMIPHCTKNTITYEMDELVRCKDCKHRSDIMYDYYGNPNNKVYVCQINDLAKKPDWFCADGERKTD